MELSRLADLLDEQIILRYYPNQNNRWCAAFSDCAVMDGIALIYLSASDETPFRALQKYAKEIAGKRIVFHPDSKERRREFVCPPDLQ